MRERLAVFALSFPSCALLVVFVAFLQFFVLSVTVAQAQGVISRSGVFVYTGNTGYAGSSNTLINGYVINATTGTLTNASGTPFATSGQIFAIAAHPSGKFVYAAIDNGTLAAFTVDSFVGTLTPVPGSPYTAQASGTIQAIDAKNMLAIDPAGKFLYLAGISSLYAFAIDAHTGALSVVPGSPFSSNGASAVAIDPSGKYLITASGSSGTLAYAIDGGTGALTAVGSVVSGCGGSFMAFEPSGHFLYATSGAAGWDAPQKPAPPRQLTPPFLAAGARPA